MKTMAFIPWSKEFMDDEMFNVNSSLNRDNCLMMWIRTRDYLQSNGWEIHTIDRYSNFSTVDEFVFFTFHQEWYDAIRKYRLEDKTIYAAFEPPVVDMNHSPAGIKKLLHYFKYILTWNDDLVDNQRVFKFMYPYCFSQSNYTAVPFQQKKLLVNISGNKISQQEGELYSERKKIIGFFDESNDFELYGPGWDKENYKSYRGIAKSKAEVYSKFKFALCLENMTHIRGYVTEKILDCFCYDIVPVYLGASNITDYIPDNTYVHYDKFKNLDELKKYLEGITEEEYGEYLNALHNYLQDNKKDIFAPEQFGKSIFQIVNKNDNFKFKADGSLYSMKAGAFIQKVKNKIKRTLKIYFKRMLAKTNPGGGGVNVGANSQIDNNSIVGDYTYIGTNCLVSRATIGRFCSIGNNVSIGPGEHRLDRVSTSSFLYDYKIDWYAELTEKEVKIGNDVWIGTDSVIKRGVTIGNGAVIGANSFVNKDVPSFAIVAGSPAKFIRWRFPEDKIKEITDSQWWEKDLEEARAIINKLEE